jgi:hypothetical protein
MTPLLPFLALLLALVSGCSPEPQAAFVGVWQTTGASPKTLEIHRDGDTYVFQDLRPSPFTGEREGPRVLTREGDHLALSNGVGLLPLGLSGDRGTLLLAGETLTRVTGAEATGLKRQLDADHAKRTADRQRCQQIDAEWHVKERGIRQAGLSAPEQRRRVTELRADLRAQASRLTQCWRGWMF